MQGMDAATGAELAGGAHLRQSIRDVLTTPVGSRVMRRDYGSTLHALVDRPQSPAQALLCVAAAADALARWEPRFELRAIRVAGSSTAGALTMDIAGVDTETGRDMEASVEVAP